jgi:hypothetical protein
MEKTKEQRKERRLSYRWPIRLTKESEARPFPGQMVDVTSRGAAFICFAEEDWPSTGQQITTRFSVPRFGKGKTFDMANYTRIGQVCRVDEVNNQLRRVAIQFAEPLFFKPGEQGISESEAEQRLSTVPISSIF